MTHLVIMASHHFRYFAEHQMRAAERARMEEKNTSHEEWREFTKPSRICTGLKKKKAVLEILLQRLRGVWGEMVKKKKEV